MRVGQDMKFAPQFAAIRGIWAGFRTAQRRLGRGAVHNTQPPIETVGVVEPTQEPDVELFPDPYVLEFLQVVVTGTTTSQTQVRGQVVPGDAGLEDEDDARQYLPAIQGLATRKAEATQFGRWQKRCDFLPQPIR